MKKVIITLSVCLLAFSFAGIAAADSTSVVSDSSVKITGVYNLAGGPANYVDLSGSPFNAVIALEPTNYPTTYALQPLNSVWDTGTSLYFQNTNPGADWIWETDRAEGPANYDSADPLYDAAASTDGRVVVFEKTFDINGIPQDSVLHIAADNGWEVFINGTYLARSSTTTAGWELSNLHESYLNTTGWQSVGHINVPAAMLVSGENTIKVLAGNEYFASDDGNNPTPPLREDPYYQYNPGALIFKMDVSYESINPNTDVKISSSASQVLAGDTVDLTVTEENTGNADLAGAYVSVDNGVGDLSAPPTSGDNGNGILEPGETWSWTVPGVVVNSDTTFTATGHGTDPLGNDITYPDYPDEQDSVDVTALNPSTVTGISASSTTVSSGDTVTLTLTEENDGDTNLAGAYVEIDNGVGTFDSSSANFSGDNGNGILEPGETWQWTTDVVVTSAITYTATGHGTDPLGNDVTYPADSQEQASVDIAVEGGATRTQGFWSTHLDFTTYIFNNYLGQPIDLGYKQINSIDELMGIFWANNAKESDGSKRSALCQARETAANQALAAILNSAMPGGKPLPSGYSLSDIASILGGTDIGAIKALNSALDEYNNSGDTIDLDPSVASHQGSADPQGAKAIAEIPFADCD
jgi:hypothetical protein